MIKLRNILVSLTELSRRKKELLVIILDIFISILATSIAFVIVVGIDILLETNSISLIPFLLSILYLPIFLFMNIYNSVFRYFNIRDLQKLSFSLLIYSITFFSIIFFSPSDSTPKLLGFIQPLIFLVFVAISRVLYMNIINFIQRDDANIKNVVIYGAGAAGIQVAALLSQMKNFEIVGFIDDDTKKVGRRILQYKIYSFEEIIKIKNKKNINEVLVSISNIEFNKRKELLSKLELLNINIKILPSIENFVDGKIKIDDFRQINVADLIKRKINTDNFPLNSEYQSKKIIITGAGGSIGSELCRQIIKFQPSKLMLIDNSEYNLYTIEKNLKIHLEKYSQNIEILPILLSINNNFELEKNIIDFKPDYIFHAAAYKHVTLVEKNISESIRNNFFGTINVVDAFLKTDCKNFILISSDKAVRPSSIMGVSKRLAEIYVQSINKKFNSKSLSIVRFGNVLDSSGSVVPLFREQINNGGPITVTHPEVTRFFMTIPEAASLILQASILSKGGEVFLLDMGNPIKILDLANKMIKLSGLEVRTDRNLNNSNIIEIIFTGLKPGEKLYEELLISSVDAKRLNNNILVAKENYIEYDTFINIVLKMRNFIKLNQTDQLIKLIEESISDFRYIKDINDK